MLRIHILQDIFYKLVGRRGRWFESSRPEIDKPLVTFQGLIYLSVAQPRLRIPTYREGRRIMLIFIQAHFNTYAVILVRTERTRKTREAYNDLNQFIYFNAFEQAFAHVPIVCHCHQVNL